MCIFILTILSSTHCAVINSPVLVKQNNLKFLGWLQLKKGTKLTPNYCNDLDTYWLKSGLMLPPHTPRNSLLLHLWSEGLSVTLNNCRTWYVNCRAIFCQSLNEKFCKKSIPFSWNTHTPKEGRRKNRISGNSSETSFGNIYCTTPWQENILRACYLLYIDNIEVWQHKYLCKVLQNSWKVGMSPAFYLNI